MTLGIHGKIDRLPKGFLYCESFSLFLVTSVFVDDNLRSCVLSFHRSRTASLVSSVGRVMDFQLLVGIS